MSCLDRTFARLNPSPRWQMKPVFRRKKAGVLTFGKYRTMNEKKGQKWKTLMRLVRRLDLMSNIARHWTWNRCP